MHEVLVNRLGGLSLPRKSVVKSTDRPDMTLDVYRGCKTTTQQNILKINYLWLTNELLCILQMLQCIEHRIKIFSVFIHRVWK